MLLFFLITYRFGKRELSTFALVDSGATRGIISTIIAADLGIEWHELPLTKGYSVGGLFRSHLIKDLKVEVLDHVFYLDINIVEGIGPFKCILGRHDFFRKVKIGFDGRKKEFEVEFNETN